MIPVAQEERRGGVEFAAFLLVLLKTTSLSFFEALITYKTCLQSSDNCTDLFTNGTFTFSNDPALRHYTFYGLLIHNGIAILPCCFLSGWSDRHGRKLIIILPLFGAAACDLLILITFLTDVHVWFLWLAEGIEGFFGSSVLISIGCLCYISDRSDFRIRTFRVGILLAVINLAVGMGMLIPLGYASAVVTYGFRIFVLTTFSSRIILKLLTVAYVKRFVVESVFNLGSFHGNRWRNLISPINVTDAVNSVFKKRNYNMRFFILILMTIFMFYSIATNGDDITIPVHIRYLYKWTPEATTILLGVGKLLKSVVLFITLALARRFHFLDGALGIAGCISLSLSSAILALCNSSFTACIAVTCGALSLLIPTAIFSVLAKLVERTECGSLFAGIGVLILLIELLTIPSFHKLQELCLAAKVPELIFVICFCLAVLGKLLFIYLKKNISSELIGHVDCEERMLLINRQEAIGAIF